MLSDIFLLKGKDLNDVSHLDIYSYPFDIDAKRDDNFIKKVIEGHEKEFSQPITQLSPPNQINYELDPPIPQKIDMRNVFTMGIENQMIIGLIFENDDNPYDYKDIFEELCYELLNNGEYCLFDDRN